VKAQTRFAGWSAKKTMSLKEEVSANLDLLKSKTQKTL
jgi:hypothetical protein